MLCCIVGPTANVNCHYNYSTGQSTDYIARKGNLNIYIVPNVTRVSFLKLEGCVLLPAAGDLTLQQRCLHHILMHLEEFPANYLALLPLSLRRELLTKLPIADVCRLEEGPFVQGIDMEDYWSCLIGLHLRSLSRRFSAKARCYGEVAACILHCGGVHFQYHYRLNFRSKSFRGMSRTSRTYLLLKFLFAVRQSRELDCREINQNCGYLFPLRYAQYNNSNDHPSTTELVDAVVHCFRGAPEMVSLDPDYSDTVAKWEQGIDDEILEFLSELTYVHMEDMESSHIDFVLALVKKTTKLQVLIMENKYRAMEYSVSLNKFCIDLSRSSFLTNLRLLEISSHHKTTGDDAGFVVSQQILEEFLLAFLSAPCSHPQEIVFCRITVQDFTGCCSVADAVPFLHKLEGTDRHYLHLKTVRFEDSSFKMSRVTPKQVSNWVGEEVCPNEYCSEAITFVVNGNRKRPYPEI